MKKFLLSAFVILAFVGYALQRRFAANNTTVPVNTSLQIPSPANQSNLTATFPLTASNTQTATGNYKDGQYLGDVADAFYGNVQVKVTISKGIITDVQFLDYPHDRGTSIEINSQAMPFLKEEAITAQSANVDIVSGATQTSLAFRTSLQSALNKAI